MSNLLTIAYVLLLLETPLQGLNLTTGYEDEILVVLLFVFSTVKFGMNLKYLILISMFLTLALLSTVFSPYPLRPEVFVLDSFLFLKPILFWISLSRLTPECKKVALRKVKKFSIVYFNLSLVGLIPHYFFKLFPIFEYRFGLPSYQFIYTNPGEFANIALILGTLLYIADRRNDRPKPLYLYLTIILLLSSLRFKSFILVSILVVLSRGYTYIYPLLVKVVKKRNLFSVENAILFLPLGVVVLAPGYSQFLKYFFSGITTPRLLFYSTSIRLATTYFPLGVGSGMFGSTMARIYYSPLYMDLGWNKYWGFSLYGDANFLNDNFWPMVIGQYGILSLLVVLMIYRLISYEILEIAIVNKYKMIVIVSIFFSLLLSTLGSALIIGQLGVLLLFTIQLLNNEKATGVSIGCKSTPL